VPLVQILPVKPRWQPPHDVFRLDSVEECHVSTRRHTSRKVLKLVIGEHTILGGRTCLSTRHNEAHPHA